MKSKIEIRKSTFDIRNSKIPHALIPTPAGLAVRLTEGELSAGNPVAIDWSRRDVTSPMGARLTQPLLKAVGIHKGDPYRPVVLDATAGFGDDSYLLVAAGCRVTAIERCAPIAAMLADAVRRFNVPLTVIHGDSVTELANFRGQVDVVYLDPMFPPGRKTVEKKPMRVLRELAGDDGDAGELFGVALRTATKRVVVKRPPRAEPLAGLPPKVSHRGQAVRYDVYIPAEIGGRAGAA